MHDVGEEIKDLIRERYGSIPKLAKQLDIPEQTIYSACNNGLTGSAMQTVMPIANALGIDPFQLLEGKIVNVGPQDSGYAEVPLYGSISAGTAAKPQTADERFPIPMRLHRQYPDAFLMRIEGNSVNRILPDGCYALINPCSSIDEPGQPYALSIGGEAAMVKRVYKLDNGLLLQPDSTDLTIHPQVLDYGDEAMEEVAIIGRVVWYTLPFEWDFQQKGAWGS